MAQQPARARFALYMVGAFAFSAAIFVVRPFYAIQRPYIP